MTADAADIRWMRLAIALGRRGLGTTWPNPSVGCVIVRDGRIVGRGWTAPGGRPHAETAALSAAETTARGATAYVSLEPCAHHGQTPPCAEALVKAGVARVVIGSGDPDPRVSGKGVATLEAAGIEVVREVCEGEAEAAQAGFLMRVREGRPHVTLKLAMTLDGRIATRAGESRWITGAAARAWVHGLRASHDAVLVGAGTAQADDPMLDLRHGVTSPRPPVRIVADTGLSVRPDSRLIRSARQQPVWLLHVPGVGRTETPPLSTAGAVLVEVAASDKGGLDPDAMLKTLGARGLTRVLCEGGGGLAASLLRAGLVDELVTIVAGKVIGGDGVAAIGALGLERLGAAPEFTPVDLRPLGGDTLIRYRRARAARTA